MPRFFRFGWRAQRPLPARADPSDTPPEERPPGCGWFDSSHELNHGLQVTEHTSPDAVASELPLSDWLGMQLAGWRACEPCAV